MGNDFSVTAFNYNKEDIGIDPETNTTFVPNQKELELFKKEKMIWLPQHSEEDFMY